ncbi:MAG: type II toxin-antitoxin system HicB family antitoxin [Gammaproteobacteria bacterium]
MKLNAVLLEAEEGGFVSMNPETGICSQGDSVEEAVVNLRDATELYLEECPDECPQEALSKAIIKTMKVAVDEDALADGA